MNINLKSLDLAYINLSSYPNRNKSMVNMLDHYGLNYTRVEGVVGKEYDRIADAHINALDCLDRAGIILEDDCVPFHYRENIEVPDDSDVVFLGVSTGTTNTNHPKYKKISNEIYRINDMTSLHAVLYLTPEGKAWLKESRELTIKERIGFDMATAILMPNIKVYGLNKPLWYQKDYPEQTQITLDEAILTEGYAGGGCPDYLFPLEYHTVDY